MQTDDGNIRQRDRVHLKLANEIPTLSESADRQQSRDMKGKPTLLTTNHLPDIPDSYTLEPANKSFPAKLKPNRDIKNWTVDRNLLKGIGCYGMDKLIK